MLNYSRSIRSTEKLSNKISFFFVKSTLQEVSEVLPKNLFESMKLNISVSENPEKS